MAEFYSARGWEIPPLPWTNLSPPFSQGRLAHEIPFDEIPLVAIFVREYSHYAVLFASGFLLKLDTPDHVSPIVAPEIVRYQKQEYTSTRLVSNRSALAFAFSRQYDDATTCRIGLLPPHGNIDVGRTWRSFSRLPNSFISRRSMHNSYVAS